MTEEHSSWDCPTCHRNFKTQSALISHGKTHVGEDSVPVAAPEPLPTPRFDTLQLPDAIVNTAAAPVMPTGTVWSSNITSLSGVVPVHVKLKKLPHYGNLPEIKKATPGSAAFDLYAAIKQDMPIGVSHWQLIPTGLSIEVPPGYVAKIVPRSGLAANDGITVLNTPGIIDSDYRGEIKINIVNNTTTKFWVKPGMRVAQMLIEKVEPVVIEYVDELSETVRGNGGFGSTGR